MEVDAVGGGQPVIHGRGHPGVDGRGRPGAATADAEHPGGGTGRISVGTGEGAREPFDAVVAGGERRIGDRTAVTQLPGGALEHHAAPQRDR